MRYLILFSSTIIITLLSCNNNEKKDSHDIITISDTVRSMTIPPPTKEDTVKSLVVEAIATKESILNAITDAKEKRKPLTIGTDEHTTLTKTISKLDDLRIVVDVFIQKKIIELLKPTNTALKALIKDISEQKDKLEAIATKIKNVSSVISTLTNIIASPIFKEIKPPVVS